MGKKRSTGRGYVAMLNQRGMSATMIAKENGEPLQNVAQTSPVRRESLERSAALDDGEGQQPHVQRLPFTTRWEGVVRLLR